jgi:hypothetical protein
MCGIFTSWVGRCPRATSSPTKPAPPSRPSAAYTLDEQKAKLALTVYGNGETTTARYGQFKDNQYYLYLLDTLDYALKWGTTPPKTSQAQITKASQVYHSKPRSDSFLEKSVTRALQV